MYGACIFCDCIAEEDKQLEHSTLITAVRVCFCPKQTKNLMNVASKLISSRIYSGSWLTETLHKKAHLHETRAKIT